MSIGFSVAPRWQILPPDGAPSPGSLPLRLMPGPGFGDGKHPSTQLCLQAIAALSPRHRSWRLLDFGSGSGILSIAAAQLGATVEAVEIDTQAIAHAERNLKASGVTERVRQCASLDEARGLFDFVVANILRPILVSFATPLVERVERRGTLVLSGLVSTDVPQVSAAYARLVGARPEIYERDEWRALAWRGE